ncbi:hypothetical protein OUZ56_022429 [Daphnia magna]|uniref:Uncharacterized protein n=1 Tax=Daphnia magna TaxID=35525 RepID=A0ABR0AWC6_9CRUS|nr:hypothetical protein OUZ56_022429 [Daphnia magna]
MPCFCGTVKHERPGTIHYTTLLIPKGPQIISGLTKATSMKDTQKENQTTFGPPVSSPCTDGTVRKVGRQKKLNKASRPI